MPKLEPVRWFAIATALVALIVHYAPSIPGALVLALVAAILGVGEFGVRRAVTPTASLPSGPPLPDEEAPSSPAPPAS